MNSFIHNLNWNEIHEIYRIKFKGWLRCWQSWRWSIDMWIVGGWNSSLGDGCWERCCISLVENPVFSGVNGGVHQLISLQTTFSSSSPSRCPSKRLRRSIKTLQVSIAVDLDINQWISSWSNKTLNYTAISTGTLISNPQKNIKFWLNQILKNDFLILKMIILHFECSLILNLRRTIHCKLVINLVVIN